MPQLPKPVSRPQLPGKIFTAETQGAAIGRGMQDVAAGVGNLGATIQKNEERADISKLNAAYASAQAELTVAWEETLRTADANDPNTAQRFREEVAGPRLEALAEQANTKAGREYATRAGAGLSAGLLTSTTRGQQDLREVAAVQNWQTMQNSLSDVVISDPFSYDSAVAMGQLQIDGLVAVEGLSSEKRLVLETAQAQTLAYAAAVGHINRSPSEGRAMLDSGAFASALTPEKKSQLLTYADSQERAQQAAAEKARKRAASRQRSGYIAEAVNRDGTINTEDLPGIMGRVANDATLSEDPAAIQSTFNYLDGLIDEAGGAVFADDPAVFADLRDRMLLPSNHPNRPTVDEVYSLTGGNGLKRETADWFRNRIEGEGSPRTEAFNRLSASSFRAANAFLTGSSDLTVVTDPDAVLNAQAFEVWARAESQRLWEEGMSPTEIWSVDGPVMGSIRDFKRDLSDPASQSAVFRGETFGAITRDPETDPFDDADAGLSTVNGKPLREATPAEMQEWLNKKRENK